MKKNTQAKVVLITCEPMMINDITISQIASRRLTERTASCFFSSLPWI